MQVLSDIRRIYGEYLTETERLGKLYKSTDGLLGVGKGPGSDPCHDRFSERLEQALNAVADGAPASRDIAEVLRFVYDTPLAHKNESMVYFMLLAVHALTERLIGLLLPEDAASLSARYEEAYPRSVRLPAQKKIAALLRSQAGDQAPPKKSILRDIFKGRGR